VLYVKLKRPRECQMLLVVYVIIRSAA
jgi:hypothetical protein